MRATQRIFDAYSDASSTRRSDYDSLVQTPQQAPGGAAPISDANRPKRPRRPLLRGAGAAHRQSHPHGFGHKRTTADEFAGTAARRSRSRYSRVATSGRRSGHLIVAGSNVRLGKQATDADSDTA